MKQSITIFSDFDGTISKVDVGNLIFKTFAGEAIIPIINSWKNNEISSKELLIRECKLAKINDFNDLFNLIDKQEIDDYFIEFVNICDNNYIDLFVVSDGLDFYIKRIFEKYNLYNLKYFSNKFNYKVENENLVIFPEFPYTDSECTKCGNCKRNHLLYNSDDDSFIIYIGDGYSDRCPVEYADIIFAKRALASYCTAKKIPFIEFDNFKDINEKLLEILSKKRLKRRKQSELKRKEIFMQG